ncbi:1,2-phenylacetyl-CoA epoxidase subunit PaaC [Aquabacterium sp.]|uniref:1,2-phenylacetyl-CoA epoxidase subunit PaaC n=1 Tax=Aquabacterium sp. TaxID=1872578 RepID=UPI002C12847F|nr:1,2-phenylacetyl-CoA epoxidase subunit PaaC [Aquabacterium sp.]HSW06181.1 1,2-phenylacetyl-CoA epoxidase subunit PaaC [Aquabacterium sp.]
MSTASISLQPRQDVEYLLRIADTALIHAQRLTEWCGHGPVLEEDIALSNIALDLLGQARALLTHAGHLHGEGGGLRYDEDQLAFLRDERDYRNLTLVELPLRKGGGDFADTVLRNLLLATWFKLLWRRLQDSSDAEVAAIAGKAVKEARYHQGHAAEWAVRLGDGTDESAARMRAALQRAWPYVPEMFEADAVDAAARASGLGPGMDELQSAWLAELEPVFAEAQLAMPAAGAFRSTGRRGVHSEHLGFMLAEMQYLQRSFPGGVW